MSKGLRLKINQREFAESDNDLATEEYLIQNTNMSYKY